MYAAPALIVFAVALVGAAPRLMARWRDLRRAPRPALVLWQAVSLSAVLAALVAALVIVLGGHHHLAPVWLRAVAAAFGVLVLARVLWSGHVVGLGLRTSRRRHRELVDVLAVPGEGSLRVLTHATPTAYCLPGIRHRVVLTQGALEALPRDELGAVLAHERAHLRARHDLVLEFFTVLHRSAPPLLRTEDALAEVHLLVEVLADRAARREVGRVPLARALVALAASSRPEATLGAVSDGRTTRTRLELLAEEEPSPVLSVPLYLLAATLVAAPFGALAWALG